jgi:deoxyribose-phosphate aldolase
MEYRDYSKMIDHALLTPNMAVHDLEKGIDLALAYDVASVCVMPYYVRQLSDRLRGSGVKSSTTIGFPHGANHTSVKIFEAKTAIDEGCQEIDAVVNISKVISGYWDDVQDEIEQLVETVHAERQKIKIIFENVYLTDEQKIKLCKICTDAKADWVKTSTGFATGGATLEDLRLMVKHSGSGTEVKAAGGVRDLSTLREVKKIGVTRCGASGTAAILDPLREELGLAKIVLKDSSSIPENPNY